MEVVIPELKDKGTGVVNGSGNGQEEKLTRKSKGPW